MATSAEEPTEEDRTSAPSEPEDRRSFLRRRWPFLAALGVLLVGGAFVGGLFAGDDSARVESLEDEVAAQGADLEEAEDELLETQGEVSDLETALAQAVAARQRIAGELQAELDFEGELPVEASGSAPAADFQFGQAGEVGILNMKPTAFEEQGSAGSGAVRWRATISVKNNGTEVVEPFCADGATLIDDAGREFTGESVLAISSPNCSGELQPGLTIDGFLMDFTLPADATPAVLALWGAYDINNEGDAATWSLSD